MDAAMDKVDAAIIGFGKGGKTLAGALAAAGKTVALVEQSSGMYGGTCINVACIPTKSLVKSAALSAELGGSFEERAQRYAEAVAEKDRVVSMLREKNYRKLADNQAVRVVDGKASFVDAHRIRIERDGASQVIEADSVFVNTGARPFVPNIAGLSESSRVFVSETMLDLAELPETLVIVGGGYIGREFASLYANFGSKVTVVQDGSAFIPREDAEIAAAVLASLEARDIRVIRSAVVESVCDAEESTVVTVSVGENREELAASAVLVATGRRPNVDGLNLEAAGVGLTARGAIDTDGHLRTTAQHIWAMGDVVGGLQFTYISLDDYRIVASDVLGDGSRTTENRGEVPYSVFVDPPFSRVGMTEQEARERGYAVKVGTLPAAAIPKAQLLRKPTGLLKVIVDAATERILGAHLFCEESHEMINTVKLAMDAGVSYTTLRDAVYTHPTMTEAFNDLFAAVR